MKLWIANVEWSVHIVSLCDGLYDSCRSKVHTSIRRAHQLTTLTARPWQLELGHSQPGHISRKILTNFPVVRTFLPFVWCFSATGASGLCRKRAIRWLVIVDTACIVCRAGSEVGVRLSVPSIDSSSDVDGLLLSVLQAADTNYRLISMQAPVIVSKCG